MNERVKYHLQVFNWIYNKEFVEFKQCMNEIIGMYFKSFKQIKILYDDIS